MALCAQAVLLLLQGLDLDAALALAADGADMSAHQLGPPDARAAVDAELLRWGKEPLSAAHAPVLLAWAAFVALAGARGGARVFLNGPLQHAACPAGTASEVSVPLVQTPLRSTPQHA